MTVGWPEESFLFPEFGSTVLVINFLSGSFLEEAFLELPRLLKDDDGDASTPSSPAPLLPESKERCTSASESEEWLRPEECLCPLPPSLSSFSLNASSLLLLLLLCDVADFRRRLALGPFSLGLSAFLFLEAP